MPGLVPAWLRVLTGYDRPWGNVVRWPDGADGLCAIRFARIIPPPAGMGSVLASAGFETVPSSRAVTVTRTVVAGGIPGWQIALIAAGAALFAAAAAVLAYRVLATRR